MSAQVRALEPTSGVPGPSSSWRWLVKDCTSQEYEELDSSGGLTCHPCPSGGNVSMFSLFRVLAFRCLCPNPPCMLDTECPRVVYAVLHSARAR